MKAYPYTINGTIPGMVLRKVSLEPFCVGEREKKLNKG